MKKNIFPFILDKNLTDDIDYLLQFIRQSLPLDKFFEKFPHNILNAKLDELELKSENRESTKYFIIKFKDNNKIYGVELTNKALSCLGITITDHAALINPLINLQKTLPVLNLKDALTNLITINNNKINLVIINSFINDKNSATLKHAHNKNNQAEINLFFIFLNELILKEINSSDKVSIQAEKIIDLARIKLANIDIINWFISDNKKNIFEQEIYYSKKYNEIDNLINKLYSFKDTTFLAIQLSNLNNHYLQLLLNLDPTENLSSYKKGIEIIENFQSKASKIIEEFQENNLSSLEQLNILLTILNAIAKYLIPNFILSKNTRIGFFQQYTPQDSTLVELKKTIQPV